MSEPIIGFFAYPSTPPSIPETIIEAVREINRAHTCHIKTWQECHVGGKIVIDVLCREIDGAAIFCADLTGANPNVMFELGYAIARDKRIWVILDTTIEASRKLFDKLSILTTVGYVPYCNSQEIAKRFLSERPWTELHDSIYAMSIAPTVSSSERETLLYLKARHDTEAAIRLSACVERYKLPLTIDDPRESSVQPLVWYAQKVFGAMGVVAHFCSPSREGAALHNSRYAFVSGLAHGFQKQLLILAEAEYTSPIDYRDILRNYRTPTECVHAADQWLDGVSEGYYRRVQEHGDYKRTVALATDLKGLRVGEYIAENEESELDGYFVETSPFLGALAGRHTLIVGRKGSGKTANLYAIASRLRNDKRNLVCVVKPVSYELESIVRLLRKYRELDEKGYLVEALWKFLLYTEIARATVAEIEPRRDTIVPGSDEHKLLQTMGRNQGELQQEFAVRLERAVQSLVDVAADSSVEKFRLAVSEALHGSILQELRAILGQVLTGRNRVAVLVDNLDKAWDKRNDLDFLTEFLLGLLRVARDIRQDFARKDYWRKPVPVTLTIFLRSDIFARLMRTAREPDKISSSRLLWSDPEVLLRVVDERLVASRGREESAERIWTGMFCPDVRGIPVRDYLVSHVLPRPRDIVFFTSAAIAAAVNRAHARVEERDIIDAEKQYSQFVFDSIQVENGFSLPELEAILYEFAGQPAVLTEEQVLALVAKAGIGEERRESAVRHLCALSFLGLETTADTFAFSAEEEEVQKNEVIARRLSAARNAALRYKVNPPFHAFLEIPSM